MPMKIVLVVLYPASLFFQAVPDLKIMYTVIAERSLNQDIFSRSG
jgi:hypothetical protein